MWGWLFRSEAKERIADAIQKRRLSRRLGRDVSDLEANSIGAWMDATPADSSHGNSSSSSDIQADAPVSETSAMPASDVKGKEARGCGCLSFLFALGAVVVFYFSYPEIFQQLIRSGGYGWIFWVLVALTLLAIGAARRLSRPIAPQGERAQPAANFAGVSNAVVPALERTPTQKREWFWGRISLVLIASMLLLIALVYVPPVRRALTIWDHRHVARRGYVSQGSFDDGIGLANWNQFYDPTLGPELLRDSAVVNNRISHLYSSSINDDWSFFYAALRLQGQTDEQIRQHQRGKELFLGALQNEFRRPEWWDRAVWLREALGLQQREPFQMGLIDPTWARAEAERLIAQPAQLGGAEVQAFMSVAARQPDFLPQASVDALLERWRQIDTQGGHATTEVLAQRRQLREMVAPLAHNGAVETRIILPEYATDEMRRQMTETVHRLLALCGFRAVPGERVTFDLSIEPRRFDAVASRHLATERQRVQENYNVRRRSRYASSRSRGWTETRSRTVNRNVTVTRQEFGEADVPTLIMRVSAGEQEIELAAPPYGTISSDETRYAIVTLRNPENIPTLQPAFRERLETYINSVVLKPWRFGADIDRAP